MSSSPRQKLKWGAFVFLGLAILSYALFQSKNLILGPQITIAEPSDGATITYPLVTISGVAKNVASITLDDRPIFVDTAGTFSEKLVAPQGYSIIKLDAVDRFGKKAEKLIHIYLPESSLPTLPSASTTVATSTASST